MDKRVARRVSKGANNKRLDTFLALGGGGGGGQLQPDNNVKTQKRNGMVLLYYSRVEG